MRWAPAATAVLVAATSGVVAMSGAERPAASARTPVANTVKVERGELSAMVSQRGTLTYRARPDGSPYAVINQARGVYTRLPDIGAKIPCGGVLYRVDDKPVVLLCGTVPVYRSLRRGVKGRDVRQLNRSLRQLGYRAGNGDRFTSRTADALRRLKRKKGLGITGELAVGEAVFLPEPVRIAKISGQLAGPAQPGAPVLSATSDTLQVRVDLDASQQGEVERGDRARIALPGNVPVQGRVVGFGSVAQAPAEPERKAADATIPAYLSLDDPAKASGLDKAPVDVDIATTGVDDALSVPVVALLGRSGGGFAVEVVRPDARRELVAVRVGLFDTGGGRVQVEGGVRAGDAVVVPTI